MAAAIASISVVGIAIGLGIPLLSYLLEARGYSPGEIGLNTAAAGLSSLLASPFATPLAIRFGMVRVLAAMLVLAGVSFVGFYAFEGFWLWFALRASLHFALTVLFILSEAWINHSAPPAHRGMVLGVYATVLSLGFAMGPLIFSLIGSSGFLPFGILLALVAFAMVPVIFAWNDGPDLGPSDDRSNSGFARHLWTVPTATAAVLVFGAVETGGFALFPVYGLRMGFSEGDGALLLTMIGLGGVVFQIPLGLASDTMRDRRVLLVICALAGMAGMIALPFIAGNWPLTAALLFVWGGFVTALYTVGLAHLGSRLTGRDLVAANAAFVFCYAAGMLTGPGVIGVSMDIAGPQGFAHALAVFFAAYVALVVMRWARQPQKH